MTGKQICVKILQKQNIARIAVICAVIIFVILKIPSFQSEYTDRDEPWYAWQSLAIYKNPRAIMLPEVNYPYYPFFPAIAAPLNAFFPPPLPVRIVSFAFGLVALLFVYLIGKKLFSEKAALAAVVFTILSPSFYFYSTRGIMDIPITALSTIVIYLLLTLNKRRTVLLVATLMAMYLIKTTSMIILPPIVLFLLIKYRKKINKKQGIAAVVALFMFVIMSLALSPHKWGYVFTTIFIMSDFGPFLAKLTYWSIWLLMGPLMALFALVGMLQLRKKADKNLVLLLLWVVCIYVGFVLTGSVWIRYYLPALPVFAAIAGNGFVKLLEKRKVFVAIIAVLALALIFWGYYWFAVYWGMPSYMLYSMDSTPFHHKEWDTISQWFAENVGEGDKLIVLSEKSVARGIVLAAEIGLSNARQQMVINPLKNEFEKIILQKEGTYFLATDDLSPERKIWDVCWLYAADINSEAYLHTFGFEKVAEFQSEFGEHYIVYKKTGGIN